MRAKTCKQLDDTYVASVHCKIKRINRTTSLDNFEITFHPGVALDNYHVGCLVIID